jgi:hypothetical protein
VGLEDILTITETAVREDFLAAWELIGIRFASSVAGILEVTVQALEEAGDIGLRGLV